MEYTIEELINKLIGPIEPVGESHIDSQRLDNLKNMCDLVEALCSKIEYVGQIDRGHYEHSIKKAAEYAREFMSSLNPSPSK